MPRYEVRRALAYTPEQLFDLAADVERYPEFLPWWIAARVRCREGEVYHTDQVVGVGPVRRRFRSKTVLRRPRRIDVTSTDRMFRRFHLTWRFDPLPGGDCQTALAVDLEMRSALVQGVFGRALVRTAGPIMAAFEARAGRLYGPLPAGAAT